MIFTAAHLAAKSNLSLAQAIERMEGIKQSFIDGNVGKSTRPWLVVDFPSLFPDTATLVGFEIETGFSSGPGKTATMNWLWDNTDFVTADYEGCSNYPVEITFPPIDVEELVAGNTQIHELLAYSNDPARPSGQRLRVTNVSGDYPNGGNIGCHTNISTAKWRAATSQRRRITCEKLTRFFCALSGGQRYALYGRQPYRTGVAFERGGEGDAAHRIEFKMFHTTTNVVQFNNYCKVSKRLAEMIDILLDSPHTSSSLDVNSAFMFLLQDVEGHSVIADGNPQYSASIRAAALQAAQASSATAAITEIAA